MLARRATGKYPKGRMKPQSIGHRVRDLRKKLGLTQVQLAAKTGLSRSQVLRIEAGERGASLKAAVALAKALRVPINALLEK